MTTPLISLDDLKTRMVASVGYVSTPANDAALALYLAQASGWFLMVTGRTLEADFVDGVPDVVQGAVADWATYLWATKDRTGVMSRSDLGGQSVSFQTLTVPVHIQSVVDAYRRWSA